VKILLTGFHFSTIGGLEIVSTNIAAALARAGHEVRCGGVHEIGSIAREGYSIEGLAPANRVARSLAARSIIPYPVSRLAELVAWCDVVIACHCHTLPMVFRAAESAGARRPVVAWLHGREVWGHFGRSYAPFLERADRLVAVSHYTSDTVEDLLSPRHRPMVIHNSLDTDLFVPAGDAVAIERFTIGTVGRQDPGTEHKGYGMLIEALARIRRRPSAPPLVLKIAGKGSLLDAHRAHAASLGVADHVILTGGLSREQLRRFYAGCDLFAFPSRLQIDPGDDISGEGFGVVNIEAAACGRPVLTSTHGGCPETIVDGVTGVLVEPTSVAAIAAGIERVFAMSPAARDAMGSRGRERVVGSFSHSMLASRLEELLDEVATC
jgi:phosphatidylinositol alpha-1,6-mannosyltransferase